ncbi:MULTISPECIES: hypothetical protein [Streptococcus]|uniref:DUF1433 domain-containing protein n=1 Tax=Streptococcus pantholopis TaxID=1811193 RepID=A0A172Q7T5_9STRE|nr:hypothetical protein [Streptococcus pantholopis]AND79482.1 hypothetical protein A0O21_05290 [Streptococcus pantholopis]
MKNKRKYFVCLGIVAVCVIGGLILFNSLKSKEEKYRAEQDRVAKYLVNHIELVDDYPIEKIEFIEFKKDNMTGFWWITTTINNKYTISLSERNFGEDVQVSHYSPAEFKIREKSVPNTNDNADNLEIIYKED